MKKISEQATRVFKGVIFEVYQWQQELYDGSYATFERLKRSNSTSILAITEDKNIIITHEEQPGMPPFYSTAGGVIDGEEKPLDAAKRELREETGYTSNAWSEWYVSDPIGKIEWQNFVYIARNCTVTEDQHLDGGEKIEVKVITFEEFITLIQADDFRDKEMSRKIMQWILTNGIESFKTFLFEK